MNINESLNILEHSGSQLQYYKKSFCSTAPIAYELQQLMHTLRPELTTLKLILPANNCHLNCIWLINLRRTHISGNISTINSSIATMITSTSGEDDCRLVIRCRALFSADEKLFGKGARLDRDDWFLTKTWSKTCLNPSLTPSIMSSSVLATKTLTQSAPLLSKKQRWMWH